MFDFTEPSAMAPGCDTGGTEHAGEALELGRVTDAGRRAVRLDRRRGIAGSTPACCHARAIASR